MSISFISFAFYLACWWVFSPYLYFLLLGEWNQSKGQRSFLVLLPSLKAAWAVHEHPSKGCHQPKGQRVRSSLEDAGVGQGRWEGHGSDSHKLQLNCRIAECSQGRSQATSWATVPHPWNLDNVFKAYTAFRKVVTMNGHEKLHHGRVVVLIRAAVSHLREKA